MNKQQKAEVYADTIDTCKNKKYTSPNGKEITIPTLNGEDTKFYGTKAKPNLQTLPRFDNMQVTVEDKDCLIAAMELVKEGETPAVLNMASFSIPGGGAINGMFAQEEELFRRTNLFESLYQFHSVGENYGIKQREERYPLDYNYGAIYTPSVTAFKSTENDNYQYLDEPFQIAVISVAAVKKPPLKEDGTLPYWVEKVLKNKITQILSVALENGHTTLVLSAFGCGAYKTPPTEMAKLFKEIIENDFNGYFKKIVFAIINSNGVFKPHNPQGNFTPFKEIIEGKQ